MDLLVDLENIGKREVNIKKGFVRIQQILPIIPCTEVTPCVENEINAALEKTDRENDRFIWPLLAERSILYEKSLAIEPGEIEKTDFEFVISPKVKFIRVYTYFRNEKRSKGEHEIGWKISNYYDFGKSLRRS